MQDLELILYQDMLNCDGTAFATYPNDNAGFDCTLENIRYPQPVIHKLMLELERKGLVYCTRASEHIIDWKAYSIVDIARRKKDKICKSCLN